MRPHPYLDWPAPIAFAHRGGASDNPENTMPAFQHAVDLGYTYLETDVHATSDGVLVAFHDADLERTCGRPGRIDELPWSEVKQVRVDGREPIPLFDDLVSAFPQARFNIDCKSDSAVAPLGDAITRHGLLDRVCIGGFSYRRLHRLRRKMGQRLLTSFAPLQITSLWLGVPVPGGGSVAQIPIAQGRIELATPQLINRAHRRGFHVHMWTIDDPDEIRRLLDLGVDGIMTDRPETLKAVLTERGEWV